MQHPVQKSQDYRGEVDMKKIILFSVLGVGMATLGFLALIWYAGTLWQDSAVCDIQNNPKVIALAKRNVFAVDCPCLTFQKGTLYHGQDTFEVMKFNIDQLDLSWNVISNRLVNIGGGCFSTELSTAKVNYDLPLVLRNLADDGERKIGEFLLGQTSIYVTVSPSSLWHMYVVGRVIPVDQIDLVKQCKGD